MDEHGKRKRNGPATSGGTAFLPIGIVFLVIAIAMMFSGTSSWIAFFTIGITFLILGLQKPAEKDEHPSSGTP
ncbi:hypothetical protein [Arthrobacter sp. MDT1-65]